MNKKILIAVSSVLAIALIGFISFQFLSKNEKKTQEVPSSLTTSKTEGSTVSSEEQSTTSESSSSEQEATTATSTVDTNSADYQILNNLDAIKLEVKKLNEFSNGTTEYWEGVRKNLQDKYGISVSDNTKGGFGMFDVSVGEQENVLSGVVMKIDYEKVSDNQVKFRVVTRTGRAGVVDGDLSYTAKEVQKAIKKDGQDVTVDYQLNINEDGKTGELVWLAGNWW